MQILETRKTKQFTFSYSQPEEYHFCLDSIIFSEFVAEVMQTRVTDQSKVLDLCAGSGVIGFELKYHLPQISKIDFVEIQNGFQPHFKKNLKVTGLSEQNFRFINADLKKFTGRYDLIVCNPPYFEPSNGKIGSCEFKNRCHFFLDCNFVDVLNTCVNSLAKNGEAFILTKDEQLAHLCLSDFSLLAHYAIVAKIRGTNVLRLTK